MTHQQDRIVGRTDQAHRLGDLTLAGALVHQTVPLGRQRVGDVEFFEDHMRRELDVAGAGRSRHRPADRLADDLVGLVGVLDRAAVLDRRCEQPFLLDELDAAAPHPAFGDAGALAAEEDHR